MAFVTWEDRYMVGIPIVDEQHKELLRLTNTLYEACRQGDKVAAVYFEDVIHRVVDYISYHFTTEEKIMEGINYPERSEHKREHESFVRKVLDDVKNFENGKSFIPNAFVHYLRNWILTHIAISDKKCANYIILLKKTGDMNVFIE